MNTQAIKRLVVKQRKHAAKNATANLSAHHRAALDLCDAVDGLLSERAALLTKLGDLRDAINIRIDSITGSLVGD